MHKDTYKVLGGLNHVEANALDEAEASSDEDNNNSQNKEDKEAKKKEKKQKKAGVSTLETKVANINLKKVEAECEVDPLFHKTSSSFDEGRKQEAERRSRRRRGVGGWGVGGEMEGGDVTTLML